MVCHIVEKGGGTLISHKPCFSANSKALFIGWDTTIREYNVESGDLVKEFLLTDIVTENPGKVAAVCLSPLSKDELISISVSGDLIVWQLSTYQSIRYTKLALKRKGEYIKHFLVAPNHSKYDQLSIFANVGFKKHKGYLAQFCEVTGKRLWTTFLPVQVSSQSMAIGGSVENQFVASFCNERLTISTVKTREQISHLIGSDRFFTCIACHPTEQCIASGDNTGRILIWRNIFKIHPIQTVFHWHTLPVSDLVFSSTGSHFFSGGGEFVLVKWDLSDSSIRHFLPRLPAGIKHISVSPYNIRLSVSTENNGIQILDSEFHFVSTIQGLLWNTSPIPGFPEFPAGLNYDPRTESLVINGSCGHIQFYSSNSIQFLFQMDITIMNTISQLRNEVVYNPEVTCLAFSSDGLWLSTVQILHHSEDCVECTLKFWFYDVINQQFSLNTSIELEHFGVIDNIMFQPSTTKAQSDVLNNYLAASIGRDRKFKIWTLVDDSSIYKEKMAWYCESIGFFHNLPIQDLSFSSDGSLLGVAFGPSLTLWDVDTNNMKTSLTFSKDTLRKVEFGHHECSHYVITSTEASLIVWDLLSLSVVWMVPIHVSHLKTDPFSNYATVFTKDNEVFVFEPSSPIPVYHLEKLPEGSDEVLSVIHVPHPNQQTLDKSTPSWLLHSQIYFLTKNKKLFAIIGSSDETSSNKIQFAPGSFNLPLTPFQALVASLSKSDVPKAKPLHHVQFGQPEEAAVRKFLSFPCHTMASVSSLCTPLLRSFVASK